MSAAPRGRSAGRAPLQIELPLGDVGAGADPPLDALEYVVVDVETTGGAPRQGHRVTEIAALVTGADGRVREELRTLVNPERPIPPFVTRLTNITHAMVADAPRFSEIAGDVRRILEGRVFVAHNARFDWTFVTRELEWATGRPAVATRTLCTLRLARKLVPELRRRSLDSLSFHYGIEIEGRHRAYGDAAATVAILSRLLRSAEEQAVYSWQGLETLLTRPAPRRRRTAMPTWIDSI